MIEDKVFFTSYNTLKIETLGMVLGYFTSLYATITTASIIINSTTNRIHRTVKCPLYLSCGPT